MRELKNIKFRGRTAYDFMWVYGDLMYDKFNTAYIHKPFFNEDRVIPDTVGQFTGLYDGNDKEIYEGDIVEVTNLRLEGFGRKMLAQIVYDEDLACFNFKALDRERCMAISIPDVIIEVIGNIHDNPDLITFKIDTHKEDEQ